MAAPTAVGTIAARSDTLLSVITLDTSGYFSDIDAGNSLTYSATGFPTGTGLSINASTGAITGTPTAADLAASFDVTVTATDEQNRTQTTTVSFVVSTAPAAAQNYYVNGTTGNDTNNGTSSGTAWRTITRANTVSADATGHVDIWVAPGDYRNQPWVPANAGASDSRRIRLRVNGTGVVNILGPSSGSPILYGMQLNVAYVSVLRESSSSYFRIDGEVVFGTNPGQVAKNGQPETVARITRGITVDAVGVELDMDMRRLAGWNGIDIGTSCDLIELAINFEQHGISHYSDGNDFGDMVWVPQALAVGS